MIEQTPLARLHRLVIVGATLLPHIWALGAAAQDVPKSASDGGPRYWQVETVDTALNLRAKPRLDAEVVLRYSSGTILHNFGCRSGGPRIWCDVQALGGGPRGYVAAEYLVHARGPDGAFAYGRGNAAERAGRSEFDATGEIRCKSAEHEEVAACRFGVARDTNGDAAMMVTRPSGQTRALFFAFGQPIGADTAEAEGYQAFNARKRDDTYVIQVGPERYIVPLAIALGG